MTFFQPHRWTTDHDHFFGPFTYARERKYKTFGIVIASGDHEIHARTRLRVNLFGHTFITCLPPIIHPDRKKVYPGAAWDAATVARLGRDWYYDVSRREYGFSLSGDGFLQVFLGRQTHDSSTTQSWSYFLPFKQWRHIRRSLYNLDGTLFVTLHENPKWNNQAYAANEKLTDLCPTVDFDFLDFDKEEIIATTRIEEREWHYGVGWWKWLSWFTRPTVSRSLDIRFSKETGERKGSWKGGTTGHSIAMQPGELHEDAFKRYCAEHEMEFLANIQDEPTK